MLSQTKFSPAAPPASARPCRPGILPRLVPLLLLFSLCLGSCGYHLASSGSSVLGDGSSTLKIKGVDNPTLYPWLPHAIRSRLRDEIGARYLAKWVDSGSADYEIQINIVRFSSREWIRTEVDTSQLYDTNLTIEAILYEGSTNKEVWRSSKIAYSERSEEVDEKEASVDIITQVIRLLADQLRNTF